MKTKRYHNTRGWGRGTSALLALVLAVGLVLAVPPLDGQALATGADVGPVLLNDGGEDTPEEQAALADTPAGGKSETFVAAWCKLTLDLPLSMTMGSDAEKAEAAALTDAAVIDYYKIAEAVPVAGYDVYEFRVAADSPYFGPIRTYVESEAVKERFASRVVGGDLYFRYAPADPASAPVDDWDNLMEEIARVCFDGQAAKVDKDYGLVEDKTGKIGEPTEDLAPGLYLTVLHGKGEEPTMVYRASREEFSPAYPWYLTQQGEGDGRLYRSVAYTDMQLYTFKPQLIALPGSTATTDTGYGDTTTGNWNYDMTAFLKPESRPRMASLMVEKRVEGEVTDPAVFVFRVSGTGVGLSETGLPEERLYEDIRTLRFDPKTPDRQETEIAFNGIKAGSTVTVTELPSDANYKLSDIGADAPEGTVTEDEDGRSVVISNIPGGVIVLTVPAGEGRSAEVVLSALGGDPVGATVTVSATNTHTDTTGTSGSVVNQFDPANEGGWRWTKWHYTKDENGTETTWQETGSTGTPGRNSGN